MVTPKAWIFRHGEVLRRMCIDNGIKTKNTHANQDPYTPLFIAELNIGSHLIIGIKGGLPHQLVREWAHKVDRVLVVDKDFRCFTAEHLLYLEDKGQVRPPSSDNQGPWYDTRNIPCKVFTQYFVPRWRKLEQRQRRLRAEDDGVVYDE